MWKPIIKNNTQINNIKESGKYLTEILSIIKSSIKPWVKLIELENIAQDYMDKNNIKWAFKWYMWFPANLCLSVNDCVVHWIPDDYVLKDWDLLKVDCWVIYNKWITDSAFSVVVWWESKDSEAYKLIETTKEALDRSYNLLNPWSFVFNFSKSVQNIVENDWFSVIKNLTGHWVWIKVHESPHIFNWPHPDTKKIKMQENMVVALEPITSIKSDNVVTKRWNSWNLYTNKWDKWAQWEYTVLIWPNWPEILSWLT